MYKMMIVGGAVALGLVSWAAEPAVKVVECQKCPFRMKIAADGKSANINKARLMDDNPSAAELDRRIAAMRARAEKLLVKPDPNAGARTRPLMGWSSWNTFGLKISEEVILGVAKAMATNGLKAAGYTYVNIDDGFWGPRTKEGKLTINKNKFPNGMRVVVDTIHSLGMKAGIYSDAGANTCGQTVPGVGFYKHDDEDCQFYFKELDFDFIKVDYCGGSGARLDPRTRYTEIANAIKKAAGDKEVRYNLCRWAFPGVWAADIAESWRTTGDIRANWGSIRGIIRENLYLSAFASPGHYNDMDMLEVGQLKGKTATAFGKSDSGLTADEELTHFGTWCMLSSPLLLGCDPRTMPQSSIELATNPYLLAMSQNDLGLQGYVVSKQGDAYVLVKDADKKFGTARFVQLLNLSDKPVDVKICARDLDLGGEIQVFDLVERADPGTFKDETTVQVPPHGSKFYRFDAEQRLDRVVYEAETAYLSAYQELTDAKKANTAFTYSTRCRGGDAAVTWIGFSEANDLIWKDVMVSQAGDYELTLDFEAKTWDLKELDGFIQIDGGVKIAFKTTKEKRLIKLPVTLSAGLHTVRLSNPTGLMEDIDHMTLVRKAK